MLNLYEIKVGQRLKLKDGRVCTVTENMEDGQWLEAVPDDSGEGDEPELVHAQDIQGLADEG